MQLFASQSYGCLLDYEYDLTVLGKLVAKKRGDFTSGLKEFA